MDYTKVIELYHRNIGRGDNYDEEGRGLKLLSNGMSTTSEALQNELLLFMLSLLVGFDSVSSVQTVLLDMAREDMDFLTTSSDRIMEMASSINAPTGSESACLGAFLLEDATRSYRTGVNTTEATDTLVELFNTMGRAILDNGDSYNIIGENRFDRFMIALENAAANQRAGYDDMVKEAEEAKKKEKAESASGTRKTNTGTAKKAASSTRKKETSGKAGRAPFDDWVSFELPKGYIRRTLDDPNADGGTREEISYGKSTDEDGNEIWEFSANIILGTSESIEGYTRKRNEGILEFYKRGMENSRFSEGPTAPDTAVYAVSRPVRILGLFLKYKLLGIIAVIDKDHLLLLQCAIQQNEDDPAAEIQAFRHLMNVGNSIRINGKAVDFSKPDPQKLVKELKLNYDEENDESSVNFSIGVKMTNADGEEIDAGTISVSGKPEEGRKKAAAKKTGGTRKKAFVPIEQEGDRLIFGGSWSMKLVSNCRLVREPLGNEIDSKRYVIKNGVRDIWQFVMADDKSKQTLRSAIPEMAQEVTEKMNEAQNVIDRELRSDNKLKVNLHASIAAGGFSYAMVKVETSDGDAYALTSTLPAIDDMGEAMQKINNEDIGIFHPFGMAWEAQWTLMMRMVASIRSVDDPEPDDESWIIGGNEYALGSATEIIPGIQCRMPKSVLKTGEGTYALAAFGLDKKQQVTGESLLTIRAFHQETEVLFDKDTSEPHNRIMVTTLGKGFAAILREKRAEEFHACLGYNSAWRW